MTVTVVPYQAHHVDSLFAMMREEGEEWSDYYQGSGVDAFIRALNESVTWVALDGDDVIGFIRCREDSGFGVFVYDLLVAKSHRGVRLGQTLIDHVCDKSLGQPVYVLSDADDYYIKLGAEPVGTIFRLDTRLEL